MNFSEAVVEAYSGAYLRRPDWADSMRMWWNGSFFVHSHPYFDFQTKTPDLGGYFYVIEKDDASARDWEVMSA